MFNEPLFLKLLFLLADTQQIFNDMNEELFRQLPIKNKKKFLRRTYYLTATTLAHIVERHYYKIDRYPLCGKFHISLEDILHYIREAGNIEPQKLSGCNLYQRNIQAETEIGFDKNGQPASTITIITDGGGKIMTAYPGVPTVSLAPGKTQ